MKIFIVILFRTVKNHEHSKSPRVRNVTRELSSIHLEDCPSIENGGYKDQVVTWRKCT